MTQTEPMDEFRHHHGDILRSIRLHRHDSVRALRRDLHKPAKSPYPEDQDFGARQLLISHYKRLHDGIARELERQSEAGLDAKVVLKQTLRSLEKVDAFRFVIENLLEAVKRDQSLNNTVQTYLDLELLPARLPPGKEAKLPEETRHSPWPWNWGSGRFLRKIMKGLKALALTLIELLTNALKVIPQLAELEIKPNIGVVGPFPTVSFDFDLKAKGISLHELFETLAGGLEE